MALALALAPGSALQMPYRSPTGPLQNCSGARARASSWTADGERASARREPGSRRCQVSQHDLSLRVNARQMANCSSAAENSELRVPQDSLFAAAVAVGENGLTFAARRRAVQTRPSGASSGGSSWAPLGLLLEGTLRHGCHACAKAREKSCWPEIQTSYDAPGCWRATGAAEAPPPRADWPHALSRSAPRYRSLLLPR